MSDDVGASLLCRGTRLKQLPRPRISAKAICAAKALVLPGLDDPALNFARLRAGCALLADSELLILIQCCVSCASRASIPSCIMPLSRMLYLSAQAQIHGCEASNIEEPNILSPLSLANLHHAMNPQRPRCMPSRQPRHPRIAQHLKTA